MVPKDLAKLPKTRYRTLTEPVKLPKHARPCLLLLLLLLVRQLLLLLL
jgi:hypothetical protein